MRFNLALIATTFLGMTLASPTACGSNLKVRADQSVNTALVLTVNGGNSSSPTHTFEHNPKLTNLIAQLSPDVSWWCIVNCGAVILEAGCIAAAIAAGEPELVLECIDANNWSDVRILCTPIQFL
jgi:hypothetical protein